MPADPVGAWLEALIARHTSTLTRSEFLKAVRALSARYVERRSELAARSPVDSAGKRAAFAAFFAPLHLLTVREIARALRPSPADARIIDLGCGTGVASAGWALAFENRPAILGVDREAWALTEAAWNWRTLGLDGRSQRGDLVQATAVLAQRAGGSDTSVVAGWSINELDTDARAALLSSLLMLARRGCSVLVIEPVARAAVPWWDDWTRVWRPRGGQAHEWKFDAALPPALAVLSAEAGFRRETLSARTLWIDGG